MKRVFVKIVLALVLAFAGSAAQSQTFNLENPQPGSHQSGISVFSGWACSADVQLVVDGVTYRAAAGTPRSGFPSTLCGGNSNVNFALLRNFNNFGAGQHTVQLVVDGVNAGSPVTFTVTVPIPSTPFASGLSKTVTVPDFPANGQTTTLTWQESAQNFAISGVSSSQPCISAGVFSFAGASAADFGIPAQNIQVYNNSSSYTPITNASVTVNGSSPLSYNPSDASYDGNIVIAAGAPVNLSVTVGGATYAASGIQYTTFPSITYPASGSTWQAASANTVTWTPGAPTAGAAYVFGIMDSSGVFVSLPGSAHGNPVEVPISSTSYIVPAGTLKAGNYGLIVGIGTKGLAGENSGGIPIPNADAGCSGLWIGGFTRVPITVY